MPKRGLPATVKMRHDSHYIDELATPQKTVGKIIKLDQIFPNPDQPRVEFGDLSELTSSIKEQGVLEPLLVKPSRSTGKYMIIAGERRWRASNLAGLEEVPCIELNIDDKSIAEIALVENLQRKDLTIWEIADGLADLNERYGYTHEDIAKKIGKSRSTVTENMSIAGLPLKIRERCQKAKINSKATLLEVSRQFDLDAMNHFLDQLEKNGFKKPKNGRQQPDKKLSNNVKSPASPSNNRQFGMGKKSSKNQFSYKSNSNNFTIKVEFEQEEFNQEEILNALKEAFSYVKTH